VSIISWILVWDDPDSRDRGRGRQEPVILNVKGLGYKIHASLAIEVEHVDCR
jgi:hypothetical protein